MTEIRVPTLGESVTEATIGRWFKKAGDDTGTDSELMNGNERIRPKFMTPTRAPPRAAT